VSVERHPRSRKAARKVRQQHHRRQLRVGTVEREHKRRAADGTKRIKALTHCGVWTRVAAHLKGKDGDRGRATFAGKRSM
jgi:hypothetical protein